MPHHCQHHLIPRCWGVTQPKYKEAATELLRENPPLRIAKMDADNSDNKEIASKFGVSGFPTLKFIKDEGSTVLDYRGAREKADIVKVQPENARADCRANAPHLLISFVLRFPAQSENCVLVQAVKNAQGPSWQEVSSMEDVDAKVKEGARVVLFAGKEPRAASKTFAAFKAVSAKV